jgi:RING-finger-containing E3 ubiquitin ligase
MNEIFYNSTLARCGIVKEIHKRFELASQFLESIQLNHLIIISYYPDIWRDHLKENSKDIFLAPPDCKLNEISFYKADQIFLDINLRDINIALVAKIFSSSAFLWFFSIDDELINRIILHRCSKIVSSDLFTELLILPKIRRQSITISYHFDKNFSTISDLFKIRLSPCDKEQRAGSCIICFCKTKTPCTLSCCRKTICKECIMNWFDTRSYCPHCRFDSPSGRYSDKPEPVISLKHKERVLLFGKKERFEKLLSGEYEEVLLENKSIYGLNFVVDKIIVDSITFYSDIWPLAEYVCSDVHYVM